MIITEKNVFVKITQLKPEYLVIKKYCKKKVILTYMVMHEGVSVSRQACSNYYTQWYIEILHKEKLNKF